MYCPYCGQLSGERDNFCTRCGRRRPVLLELVETLEVPAAVPVPFIAYVTVTPRGAAAHTVPEAGEHPAWEAAGVGAGVPAVEAVAPDVVGPSVPETPLIGGTAGPVLNAGAEGAEAVVPYAADTLAPETETPVAFGAVGAAASQTSPEAVTTAAATGVPVPPTGPATSEFVAVAQAEAGAGEPVGTPAGKAPRHARKPAVSSYMPWGTRGTRVRTVMCVALALVAVAALAAAPIVALPLLAQDGAVSNDVLQAVLAGVDPSLSVVMSGLLGTGWLASWGVASVGVDVANACASPEAAVVVGAFAGLVVVSCLLVVSGCVATLLHRRVSPVLPVGALVSALTASATAIGVRYLDAWFVRGLRADLSSELAGTDVHLPADLTVLEPTVLLVAVAALAFVALVLGAVARHRWLAEHPAWGR